MAMAKAYRIVHPAYHHIRGMYLLFDRNLKRTEQFFIEEFGMPKRVWDSIPKTLITSI